MTYRYWQTWDISKYIFLSLLPFSFSHLSMVYKSIMHRIHFKHVQFSFKPCQLSIMNNTGQEIKNNPQNPSKPTCTYHIPLFLVFLKMKLFFLNENLVHSLSCERLLNFLQLPPFNTWLNLNFTMPAIHTRVFWYRLSKYLTFASKWKGILFSLGTHMIPLPLVENDKNPKSCSKRIIKFQ